MKLVILDRDGVINQDRDDFVKNSMEWVPIPRAIEAIANLSQAGWKIVVATNQSGIGRGLFDMHALNAMHEKMHRLVNRAGGRIEAVFFCPHRPEAGCSCRKPKPGMVLDIAERFGVRPENLYLTGASTHPGGGVFAASGYNTAQVVLKDVKGGWF